MKGTMRSEQGHAACKQSQEAKMVIGGDNGRVAEELVLQGVWELLVERK